MRSNKEAVVLATEMSMIREGVVRHPSPGDGRGAGGEGKGRTSILLSALALFFLLPTASLAQGDNAPKVEFSIAAQPMETALTALGAQSGLTIIVETKVSKGIKASALSGFYTAEEALKKLLEPAGLKADYLDNKTVAVRLASEDKTHTTAAGLEKTSLRLAQNTGDTGNTENTGSETAPNEKTGPEGSPSEAPAGAKESLQEIIVTAQKRLERLQDVPVPVTAIKAEALVNSNQLRLQDYYTRIPSLSLSPDDLYGAPKLTIRGITTGGFTNPTVGIMIDDVPYGSSYLTPGGYQAPDIDPSELSQLEVLRGPQGTLYGACEQHGRIAQIRDGRSIDRAAQRASAEQCE
jgi:hypothetical protein